MLAMFPNEDALVSVMWQFRFTYVLRAPAQKPR
jgi:hypothetical protein